MSRTFTRRQGLIAGGVVATVHLLFLLYLHFAYHSVYEGLSHFHRSNKPDFLLVYQNNRPMQDI